MNRTSQAGSARTVEVAEATEQRKEEHGEYIQFMEENNAAVQLLEKAKNKLNKFYRPTQCGKLRCGVKLSRNVCSLDVSIFKSSLLKPCFIKHGC